MSTVITTFPDGTYTTSNKPSVETLKTDIQALETGHNELETRVIAATTSASGTVELATTAETTTGTDATRAVTPDGLHDMTSLAGAAWFKDEDNMVSDSATTVPSQQSVKAYVDTSIATQTSKTYVTPVINTSISGTAIASGAEVTTGTDDTQIVTPKALGDAGVNTRLKSKVITATRDLTAASGNVSYTGVGFTPTAIVCFANIDNTGTSAYFSFGAVDSAKTEGGLQYEHETAVRSTATLVYIQPAASNNQTAVVDSFDADGFTLTWTKANSPTGTAQLVFICFS